MGKDSKEGFGHESKEKERNFDLGSKEEQNKAQTLISYEKGREERGLTWLHEPQSPTEAVRDRTPVTPACWSSTASVRERTG